MKINVRRYQVEQTAEAKHGYKPKCISNHFSGIMTDNKFN